MNCKKLKKIPHIFLFREALWLQHKNHAQYNPLAVNKKALLRREEP